MTPLSTPSVWAPAPGKADYQYYAFPAADGTVQSIGKPINLWFDGRDLYVRLVTTRGGTSHWRDYVVATPDEQIDPLARMIAPAPGTVIPGSQTLFTWTEGSGDSHLGEIDEISDQGRKPAPLARQTSFLAAPGWTHQYWCPACQRTERPSTFGSGPASAVSGRIWTIPTRPPSLLWPRWSSPAPDSVIGGSTATFTWTEGVGVSEYRLRVGSGPGGSDLYDTSMGSATSATVSGLPDSGNIHVRLSSRVQDVWIDDDYVYQGGSSELAEIITPGTGGSLASSETFMWTQGAGVVEYRLMLGTAGAGSSDIFDQLVGSSTSRAVTGIPEGEIVYLRLSSRFATGEWGHRNYVYGAAKAEMIYPAPAAILPDTTATFDWSSGSGVAGYWLYVGTTGPGSSDIFSGGGSQTSRTVTGPAVLRHAQRPADVVHLRRLAVQRLHLHDERRHEGP